MTTYIYYFADYGAIGNGTTDDTSAIQSALNAASATGGAVLGTKGKGYKCTAAPVVPDHVVLDLCGSALLLYLSGTNDTGVGLGNHSEIRNGSISVHSSGTPSLQGGVHAAITIGPIYGAGGTSSNPVLGPTGWAVRDMMLSTDKWVSEGGPSIGGLAIQVMGDASNGLIERVFVPDSTRMAGAVHLDWGFVGSISSSDVPGSRANFNAGTAWTTHPNNIIIRDIHVGRLTAPASGQDTGSNIIRLSGVYNIRVENVRVGAATYSVLTHTAGDLGFEFAPASVKPFALQNVSFSDCAVADNSTGNLVYSDSYADNVARAVSNSGYVPILDPIHATNIVYRRISGKGPGNANANYGIRVIQQQGGAIEDCDVSYYKQGMKVDELVRDLSVARVHAHFNREHGISVDHQTRQPEDIILDSCVSHDNGQDAGFSNPCGIYIDGSRNVSVSRCVLGHSGAYDPTQKIGVHVNENARETVIENTRVRSARPSDGLGFVLLSGNDYGKMGLFRDNHGDPAFVPTLYGGLNIVPVRRHVSTDGRLIREFLSQREALSSDVTPTAGTWAKGDRILFSNPQPGSNFGSVCTTGGTIGSGAVFKALNGVAV